MLSISWMVSSPIFLLKKGLQTIHSNHTPETFESFLHSFMKEKKIEAAMHAFDLSMKRNPNNPLVMYHLAQAHIDSKDKEKAKKMIGKILEFEYLVPLKNDAKKLLQNIK